MSHDVRQEPDSILEAIRMRLWDYEPNEVGEAQFNSTEALPGTRNKLDVLAERAREGLPLWHSSDYRDYDDISG